MKTSVIYEPAGKAGEYNRLAVNLYSGCAHGCLYCYAPQIMQREREVFHQVISPREKILERLNRDASGFGFEKPDCPILLCFTCDPYQPMEAGNMITRQAIQILKGNGLAVKILTKGALLARRDFDLLTSDDWFGVTLTCENSRDSLKWEPLADSPEARMESLWLAHEKGIRTWVSFEPVLYPEQTLKLIELTHGFVDDVKVGILNYHSWAARIDWQRFASNVKEKLEQLHCNFYLKRDLRAYL